MMATVDYDYCGSMERKRKWPRLVIVILLIFWAYPTTSIAQQQPFSRGCDPPLLQAIYRREMRAVHRLIEERRGIDLMGCDQATPLVESIALGLPDVAKRLILSGASPNLAAEDGTTPLIQAAWYRQEEIVSLLLERGAVVNAQDKSGDTALIAACQHDLEGRIIRKLLKAGADVNIRASFGASALTTAAFYGNESAIRQLVAAGADLTAKSDEGTALTIARDRVVGRMQSHDRIYKFLLEQSRRASKSR